MTKPIVIENPQNGIAPSAFYGFQEIRGLNITDKPGVCSPNNSLTAESGQAGPPAAFIPHLVKGVYGSVWGYDNEDDHVYKRATADSWLTRELHSAGGIYNICKFQDKIGIIKSQTIDWYTDSALNEDTCDNAWSDSALSSGGSLRPWCVADNSYLYVGCGRFLDEITDATDDSSVTKAVATLPVGESIKAVLEIGDKLYLVSDYKIFPFTKGSELIENPIVFNRYIQQAIVVNNTIYFAAGYQGEWFMTNGTSVFPVGRIPMSLLNLGVSDYVNISQPALYKTLILFGVYGQAGTQPQGIYSLNPTNGAINLEYITTAKSGSLYSTTIGQILTFENTSDGMLIPWQQSSETFGVDRLHSIKYTGDDAFLISAMYNVGSPNNKMTFNKPKLVLTKPLMSGDSAKIYYRKTTVKNMGSWTNVISYVFGDVVSSLGSYYFCIGNNSNQSPPNATYWYLLEDDDNWKLHETINTVGTKNKVLTSFPALEDIQVKIVLNKTAEFQRLILE